MTQILSNLDTSKILEKNGNQWKIEQKGQTSHAGFTYKFESTKLITLKPYETLQSHLIGGTLKQHESLTTLTPDGNGTRIVYHAESISGVWVPPLLGASVVEGEVLKQFHDMEAEMIKRNLAKTAK
jgi:predicted RNA binding protein YcfA (HicA-like mRNA interferase family)